jgi:hypothetical protein
MLLVPDMRTYGIFDQRDFIATSQSRLGDDAGDLLLACPGSGITMLDLGAWAVTSRGPAWNITGPTNTMQAADCGAGCGWTGESSLNVTVQVLWPLGAGWGDGWGTRHTRWWLASQLMPALFAYHPSHL